MTVSIIKGAICVLIVLLAANVFGTISSQGQSVPSSEDNIINILGIDPTAYPKIKVNIFVDELCAATGALVKDDFTVEEDGTRVAIDNFYFMGKASGQKLDLAVVFDETDTMADEIRAMKSNVDDLTNKIKASDIDARYSLVSFENEVMPKIEWTDDPEVFKREVNQLRAYGGFYQRPEDSLGGVAKALSFGFRPDAQKIIIVITDEPSMQRGDGWSNSTYHQDDVQQELLDAGVMLVAVSPDFRSRSIPSNIPRSDLPLYADMRELAQNSGGLWIDIYSADFSFILDQLEDIITGTYVIEYISPSTTTMSSRTVSVSVSAPECAEGGASGSYIAPESASIPNEPPIIIDLTSDMMSPQEAGSMITWTIDAADPNSDQVLYKFFLNDEPTTDWTPANTWTWTAPSEEGSYRIEAQVRDGKHAGPNGMDDRKSINFEIVGPNEPPRINSLAADKTSPQEAGAVITWTAEATDVDSDDLEYKFYLDGEIVVQDWSTESIWVWSTSDSDIGSHFINVEVRDGKHNANGDDYRSSAFELFAGEISSTEPTSTNTNQYSRIPYIAPFSGYISFEDQQYPRSSSNIANNWESKGEVLSRQGLYNEALDAFDEAIRFDSQFAAAWQGRGWVLSQLVRYEEAKEAYDEAIRIEPQKSNSWNGKGVALWHQGNLDEAISCFDMAIQLDPEHSAAWTNKGLILMNMYRIEEALQAFNGSILNDPGYFPAWFNKARILLWQGKYDEAIQCYGAAILIAPDNAAAWNNKGVALYYLGRYDDAIQAFDEAIRCDPEVAGYWWDKGLALEALGKYDEAIQAFDEAIQRDPEVAGYWWEKGLALESLGRISEADAAYSRAQELYPLLSAF